MTNEEILNVKSPKEYVGGPYAVVLKNDVDLWAVVALDWDGKPTLGIRWFNSEMGSPSSRNKPIWFILPSETHSGIINNVKVPARVLIEDFLSGKITGEDLKQKLEL